MSKEKRDRGGEKESGEGAVWVCQNGVCGMNCIIWVQCLFFVYFCVCIWLIAYLQLFAINSLLSSTGCSSRSLQSPLLISLGHTWNATD